MQIDQPEIIINQPQAPTMGTPLNKEPTVITANDLIEQTKQNLLKLEQLTGNKLQ